MFVARKEGQDYERWLLWSLTDRCNLHCAYCATPSRTTALINRIDIKALINTLDSAGSTFKIGFTGGGEPFMVPNIVDACQEITRKHYVAFNTNLTANRVAEFAEKIDTSRVLYIIASLHIRELERLNLMEKYLNNYLLCKEKGFTIVSSVVVYPPLLDEAKRYRETFQKRGIDLNFDLFVGMYNDKLYPDSYTDSEVRELGLKMEDTRIFRQKGKLCNAGFNVGIVEPDGNVRPCQNITRSIGNIYDNISYRDKLLCCPFQSCMCPLNVYDPYLMNKAEKTAMVEQGTSVKLTRDLARETFKLAAARHLPPSAYEKLQKLAKKLKI